MYSIALSSETAQMICGVPGSNFSDECFSEKPFDETVSMLPPQPIAGVISAQSSFLIYNIPIHVSAIILCPVAMSASHANSFTSTLM